MSIFAWIKSLFMGKKSGHQDASAGEQQQQASVLPSREIDLEEVRLTGDTNTGIAYYPKLVDNLKDDHQHLLGLYTLVLNTIDKMEYTKIPGQLEVFKTDFHAHLNTENIKFYGYLEKNLKETDSEEEYKSIRTFRREMNSIANTVNKFLNNWINSGIDSSNVDAFTEELKGIGAALVKRIESEENKLYPIYSAKNAS